MAETTSVDSPVSFSSEIETDPFCETLWQTTSYVSAVSDIFHHQANKIILGSSL